MDVKELGKICRGCMNCSDLSPLFTLKSGENMVSDVFNSIIGVEIHLEDGLPQNICAQCITSLIQAQLFIDQCRKSHKVLTSIHSIQNEVSKMGFNINSVSANTNFIANDDITEICFVDKHKDTIKCLLESKPVEPRGQEHHESIQIVQESAEVESKTKKMKCAKCEDVFSCKKDLMLHYKKSVECKSHACPTCNKTFTKKYTLTEHMKMHGGATFKCSECPKKFYFAQNMRRHQKLHKNSQPYNCHLCAKSYTTGLSLQEHIRSHTGETPFSCEYCGKTFKRYSTHYIHVKRHKIREGPVTTRFQCNVCLKSFVTKWEHKAHANCHSKSENKCPTCLEVLPDNESLDQHIATHIQEAEVITDIDIQIA